MAGSGQPLESDKCTGALCKRPLEDHRSASRMGESRLAVHIFVSKQDWLDLRIGMVRPTCCCSRRPQAGAAERDVRQLERRKEELMDRSTAEKLMAIYRRLGTTLNEADPLIRRIADEVERKQHLHALGTMMQDVWLQLMAPIVREYRDLDPDKKASK